MTSLFLNFFLIKVLFLDKVFLNLKLGFYFRITNPTECECVLRYQHTTRPQLCSEAAGGERLGEGGGVVQELHPGQEEGHQQGQEEAAGAGLVICWLFLQYYNFCYDS